MTSHSAAGDAARPDAALSGMRRREGERTRTAILDAARHRFATWGFDRTTIRAVAADAAIDPSMVMRYFGSKEGLFRASARFDVPLLDSDTVPLEELGEALMRALLRREQTDTFIALRAAMTNHTAAEQLHETYLSQIAALLTPTAGPDEAAERASLVASQLIGLAISRHILAFPALHDMPDETLIKRVAPTLQRYLTERW